MQAKITFAASGAVTNLELCAYMPSEVPTGSPTLWPTPHQLFRDPSSHQLLHQPSRQPFHQLLRQLLLEPVLTCHLQDVLSVEQVFLCPGR